MLNDGRKIPILFFGDFLFYKINSTIHPPINNEKENLNNFENNISGNDPKDYFLVKFTTSGKFLGLFGYQ